MIKLLLQLVALTASVECVRSCDIEVNTPGVNDQAEYAGTSCTVVRLLRQRCHRADCGCMVAVRDVGAIPLAARQSVNGLVSARIGIATRCMAKSPMPTDIPNASRDSQHFAQRWISVLSRVGGYRAAAGYKSKFISQARSGLSSDLVQGCRA